MALRLLNQINRNFVRNLKTRALVPQPISTNPQESTDYKDPNGAKDEVDFSYFGNILKTSGQKSSEDPKSLKFGLNDSKESRLLTLIKSHPVPRSSTPMLQQARCYSAPDSDKCKIKQGKQECKKFKLCNCDQSKFETCRITVERVKCTKKLAPYPSFSESCVETPYNKPSECKLCPWNETNNPSFKGPIVKYHTHTGRGLSTSAFDLNDPLSESDSIILSPVPKNAIISKPDIESIILFSGKSDEEECESDKCVKFPFKPETYEIGKDNRKKGCEKDNKCVKKKRKLIDDCPPPEKSCISYEPINYIGDNLIDDSKGMFLQKKKKGSEETCEISDCSKAMECPKKKGTTLNCPKDLIRPEGYKRKPKKNKKQTSALIDDNTLAFIPNPIYNGGVTFDNKLNMELPQSK